jgi:DNA-binding MarR family transcriptional regulator
MVDEKRLQQSFGYMTTRVASEMRLSLDRVLVPHGITAQQWIILTRCGMPGNTSPAELAEALHITPSAVTKLLDRLETSKLVKRTRSKIDRRFVTVQVTENGQALLRKLPPVVKEVNDSFTNGFSDREKKQLLALLRRLLENTNSAP